MRFCFAPAECVTGFQPGPGVARRADLRGQPGQIAGPKHRVEGLGGPLDHVEGVEADLGVRCVFLGRGDIGTATVHGDRFQPAGPLRSQLGIEGGQGRLRVSLADPHHIAGVMIGNHGQIGMTAPIGDLVHPDPVEIIQPGIGQILIDDAGDDLIDHGPRTPQQAGQTGLVHPLSQPRHQVLEITTMPGAGPRPRHILSLHRGAGRAPNPSDLGPKP